MRGHLKESAMKWEGHEQSSNIEDRRGQGAGGGGGRRIGGRGVGIGTIVIALVAGWIFGVNPLTVLGLLSGGGGLEAPQTQQVPAGKAPVEDKAALFVSTVLRDTEVVWGQLIKAGGSTYQEPKLVLFRGATPTACGTGDSAMGPFYCPGDRKVYLDLDFFDTLSRRMGAPGDFAQAYVVAHEVGHHLQNLMGITGKVDAMRGKVSQQQMNALSVRVELQADCLAGVWAHHSQRGKGWLDQGDIQEALNAAAQIGDDTLQKAGTGRVVPESFTHGSAQQRMTWFKRGLDSGSVNQCNTFDAK
jgi:predicted metalloprotease